MNNAILAAWMQAGPESGTSLETILLLFGVVVFVVLAPRLIRKGRPRPGAAAEASPPMDRHAPSSIRVRETVDRALVELVDTSREISAQIDNRIRMLNKLVKDADEERNRLETLLAEIRAEREAGTHGESMIRFSGTPYPEPQAQDGAYPVDSGVPGSVGARAASAPGVSGDGERAWDSRDAACRDGTIHSDGEAPPSGGEGVSNPLGGSTGGSGLPPPEPTAAAVGSAMNQAYVRIAALAAEGREPAEIARRMRLSTAEVNLVLHILECQKG